MALFDPGKMAVYRHARHHTCAVHALLKAAGEWRSGKRLHYLMIAKGSTWESWAHTDSLVDFGLVPADAIAEARDAQRQITALLITTIRSLETELRTPPNPDHRKQEF
jgi:hypothetical protein